jgi:PST family polysaccharide transporter
MMIGLGVVAHPFVVVVFGDRWSPTAPLIMIFALTGVFHSITGVTTNICLTKGRSDWLFWWGFVVGAVTITGFFCGLPWGIVGVAAAYAIVMVPLACLGLVFPFRLINLPFSDLLVTLRPYAGASVGMGGVVLGLRLMLENAGYEPLWVLPICVLTGIVSYMSIILRINPPAFADLIRLLPVRFRCLDRLYVNAESPLRPR